MFLLLFAAMSTIAQSSVNVLVELSTVTLEEDVLLHLRVPRGQTIERVTIIQDELSTDLDIDVLPLDETVFIMLDASDGMVNLQQVVQANVSRLWQTDEQQTGLIFYAEDTELLLPTTRTDDIDNFLAGYNSNPGAVACTGDALSLFDSDSLIRDDNRSWRILLITVGDFSGTANCAVQGLPAAPSALDVIAIAGEIDPALQDLVDTSGGRIYPASLRSVEARINEIIAEFGKLTYAVEGTLPDGWDRNATFEMEVEFSNGVEETQVLSFRDYNVPVPPTPLPAETETPLPPTETPVAEETDVAGIVAATPDAMSTETSETPPQMPDSNNGVAVLLIIAAILFVIGAVVVALALSRVRRRPVEPEPVNNANFYESLSAPQQEQTDALSSTRIRERSIVQSADNDPVTRIAPMDETFMTDADADIDENDHLLVTQVLSDSQFQTMMEQSQTNDEIVGWMRLTSAEQADHRDFELTRRGAVVGRSQDCDIQITGDRAISRQHARLDVRNNDQVTVSRLSAVNPVIVGGVQISNRHPLEPNDVIHLSDETRLIFIARAEDNNDTDDTQI